jgi:menaquinone-dependent protoporphyrinogen oxidase
MEEVSEAGTATIAIVYATRDGQSKRIAERIAERLGDHGATRSLHALRLGAEPEIDAESDAIVAVLAVRYGRVLPEAREFLQGFAGRQASPPLALALVNLVARNPSRRGPETNPYLRQTLARYRLKPALATAFGGRLNYPKYRFFDRQIIRLIMAMTGGVADGRSDIDYTDWAEVDSFAATVIALAAPPSAVPAQVDAAGEGSPPSVAVSPQSLR